MKKTVIGIIIGALIVFTIDVAAEAVISSGAVSYSNAATAETTVSGALDELFSAVDINNKIGTTDISNIGDGTITGAIVNLSDYALRHRGDYQRSTTAFMTTANDSTVQYQYVTYGTLCIGPSNSCYSLLDITLSINAAGTSKVIAVANSNDVLLSKALKQYVFVIKNPRILMTFTNMSTGEVYGGILIPTTGSIQTMTILPAGTYLCHFNMFF